MVVVAVKIFIHYRSNNLDKCYVSLAERYNLVASLIREEMFNVSGKEVYQ